MERPSRTGQEQSWVLVVGCEEGRDFQGERWIERQECSFCRRMLSSIIGLWFQVCLSEGLRCAFSRGFCFECTFLFFSFLFSFELELNMCNGQWWKCILLGFVWCSSLFLSLPISLLYNKYIVIQFLWKKITVFEITFFFSFMFPIIPKFHFQLHLLDKWEIWSLNFSSLNYLTKALTFCWSTGQVDIYALE